MGLRIAEANTGVRITLARPPRNELDRELLDALITALAELAARDVPPPLLLDAEGRHFSTGYTIEAIPEEIFHRDPEVRAADPFERVMRALVDYPMPVIAAIQGDAYGGAVELLACCDLRVAATGVRFGVPSARLGLVYSHTGVRRLLRGFGSALTRELLLTGEAIPAERAHAAGFLNRLVPVAEVPTTAREMLASVARGRPGALRGTRRVLRTLEETETLPADLLAEIADLRHASRTGDEFHAAREAHRRRRPADDPD